jgi:demethylmenaquinone methyltransferase/2-methoxy-6-polyprenyl-1,4-benzoquinol methylase
MSEKNPPGFPLQDYYSRIFARYDLVNRLFTFGLDKRWRLQTVRECLKGNPQRILDLCCGTGDLALEIARTGDRQIKITGYDLNTQMLEVARKKAFRFQHPSLEFLQGDAGSMPFAGEEFDRITIGFGFRNLTWENPERERYLAEISRVLKPGALLLILESAVPGNPVIRLIYRFYLRQVLVPLGGLLSGDWNAYRYLAGSSSGFHDFNTLKAMLQQFGLDLEPARKFLFGSVNLLIAKKKGT